MLKSAKYARQNSLQTRILPFLPTKGYSGALAGLSDRMTFGCMAQLCRFRLLLGL
jgi:hypothetical protein